MCRLSNSTWRRLAGSVLIIAVGVSDEGAREARGSPAPAEVANVYVAVRDLSGSTRPVHQKELKELIARQFAYSKPDAPSERSFGHATVSKEADADVVCEFTFVTVPRQVSRTGSFGLQATLAIWDKQGNLLASVVKQGSYSLRGWSGVFGTKPDAKLPKSIGEFLVHHFDPANGTSTFQSELKLLRTVELSRNPQEQVTVPTQQDDWFVRSTSSAKGTVFVQWTDFSPAMGLLHVDLHRAIDKEGWLLSRSSKECDVIVQASPQFKTSPELYMQLYQPDSAQVVTTYRLAVDFTAVSRRSQGRRPTIWSVYGSTSSILSGGETSWTSTVKSFKESFTRSLTNLRTALNS